MSGLFGSEYGSKLKSLPDISKWNTCNVKYLGGCYKNIWTLTPLTNFEINNNSENNGNYLESGMFNKCYELSYLPDISKWNTNNVINISYLFSRWESLSSLPDISKWEINNVNNMSYLLSGCYKLSSLPDISKWDTNNVVKLNHLFSECKSL